MGWSVVCDYSTSWSYSLAFCVDQRVFKQNVFCQEMPQAQRTAYQKSREEIKMNPIIKSPQKGVSWNLRVLSKNYLYLSPFYLLGVKFHVQLS